MSKQTCFSMLDVLCPMHLVCDTQGVIQHAGPTTLKISPDGMVGKDFLDVFDIKRPRQIRTLEALFQCTGVRVNLTFRAPPFQQIQGVLMAGPEEGLVTLNLSFGIGIVDAVRDLSLTAADFAPTDLTVEMLYLVEAKTAAMNASRQLNERLQRARVEAEEQALTDTLTGLKNRRAMDRALSDAIAVGEVFSLMHMDLDFFKSVNDTLGHAAGDLVLQEVGRIMVEETRTLDIVARVGGDEFVILLRGIREHEIIERIAQRIIKKLEVPIPFENEFCCISGSAGTVISADYPRPTADQLLSDADEALYAAKHAGRGCHKFFVTDIEQASRSA